MYGYIYMLLAIFFFQRQTTFITSCLLSCTKKSSSKIKKDTKLNTERVASPESEPIYLELYFHEGWDLTIILR